MESVGVHKTVRIVRRRSRRQRAVAIGRRIVRGLERNRAALRNVPESVVIVGLRKNRAAVRSPQSGQIVVFIVADLAVTGSELIADRQLPQTGIRIPGQIPNHRRAIHRKFALRHASGSRIVAQSDSVSKRSADRSASRSLRCDSNRPRAGWIHTYRSLPTRRVAEAEVGDFRRARAGVGFRQSAFRVRHRHSVYGCAIVHKDLLWSERYIRTARIRDGRDPVQRIVGVAGHVAVGVRPFYQVAVRRAPGGIAVVGIRIADSVALRILLRDQPREAVVIVAAFRYTERSLAKAVPAHRNRFPPNRSCPNFGSVSAA